MEELRKLIKELNKKIEDQSQKIAEQSRVIASLREENKLLKDEISRLNNKNKRPKIPPSSLEKPKRKKNCLTSIIFPPQRQLHLPVCDNYMSQ